MNGYLKLNGTHRAQLPSETLAKLSPLLKKIGITRVANITGLDSINVPVAIAIRPNSKHLSVSQGKGITLELAKVSAIMESMEQWHAENIPLPKLSGKFSDLVNEYNIIDPRTIAHSNYLAEPLLHWQLSWMEGINLINNENVFLPYEALCLDSTKPNKAALLFQTSTNGLASGNTKEEAIYHALCEVIERDAYFKWRQLPFENQQHLLLNNTTIHSDLAQEIFTKLNKNLVDCYLWNITTPLGIPAFYCALSDKSLARNAQVFAGKGCHHDKEVALLRAITEAIQIRLTYISGSRDDVFPSYYKKNIGYLNKMIAGVLDYQSIPQPKYQNDFQDNVNLIINQLKDKGYHHVVCVDHTCNEIDIPVVHIVIPQLEALLRHDN